MNNVACYIDGFNLYHAIDSLGNERLKWLNLSKLASTFLRRDEQLVRVVYFTALLTIDPQKLQRHKGTSKNQFMNVAELNG
jgi:formylmethanofuran dehydrogenase subunit E